MVIISREWSLLKTYQVIDVEAEIEQHLNDRTVAVSRCQMQWRVSLELMPRLLSVDFRPPVLVEQVVSNSQQQFHRL